LENKSKENFREPQGPQQ